MRQAYLDAGFKHVPDLLQLLRDKGDGSFSYYPIDHHFTSYSAWLWAAEAARPSCKVTSAACQISC
ncbi:MAG: hypothetical protein R2865_02815 [Deinococcales bacterium]